MEIGKLVLTTKKLFFINLTGKSPFKVVDLPLELTYDTRFDEPMIGKNHWHGRCHHLDDLLTDDIEFKIYFQGIYMKF
jgi:hypothetical protein